MTGCPEQISPTLDELIKAKLLNLAHEQNVDEAAKLNRITGLNQSPWQPVDHEFEPIPSSTTPVTKRHVEELFDYIKSPEISSLLEPHP